MWTLLWLELRAMRAWLMGLVISAFCNPMAVYLWHRFSPDPPPSPVQIEDATGVGLFLGWALLVGYLIRSHFKARGFRELSFLSRGYVLWETFGRSVFLGLIWTAYAVSLGLWGNAIGPLFYLLPRPWYPLMLENLLEALLVYFPSIGLLVLWDRFALVFRIHGRELLASIFFLCGTGAVFYWIFRGFSEAIGRFLPPIRIEHPLYFYGVLEFPQELLWAMISVTVVSLSASWALTREVEL